MNSLSLLRCLSGPSRLAVLTELREQDELSVGALSQATGIEQTNISHQLRELKACGLVTSRQEGKRILYRSAHPRLGELLDLVDELAEHVDCQDPRVCQEAGCC